MGMFSTEPRTIAARIPLAMAALLLSFVGVVTALPPPAAALAPSALHSSATFGVLTSVSCPSTSFCAAVDLDGNALTYQAPNWSVANISDSRLYGVSCVTATNRWCC